jgi:hypothetical protein
MNVGSANIEVLDEYVAEAFVIILAGVNSEVFAVLIQNFHDQAEPDYFGTRPEDRHDLHKVVLLPCRRERI